MKQKETKGIDTEDLTVNLEYLILDLHLIYEWKKNWLSFSCSEPCPF